MKTLIDGTAAAKHNLFVFCTDFPFAMGGLP